MSPSAREYLQHMLDETTYILTSSVGSDKTDFSKRSAIGRFGRRAIGEQLIGE